MNKYFNVYGARYNKDKTRINISLVHQDGDDEDNREWANISIKIKDPKINVKEKGVYLAIPFLKNFDEDEKSKAKSKAKRSTEKDTLPL